MKNYGLRLKKLREAKGLTLEHLGRIVNCHYFMLRDWENNKRTLTIRILIELSKYFGVTTDYLLGL